MPRQLLEPGVVTKSRAHSTLTYRSFSILVCAMNPCPCGYLGSLPHYCTCFQRQIQVYRNQLSGHIYDRIDIHIPLQ